MPSNYAGVTSNYDIYLNRMSKSMPFTTKAMIPEIAKSLLSGKVKPRILDVGLGSGIVGEALRDALPNAIIDGIDINQDNIEKINLEDGVYDTCICADFTTFKTTDRYDLIVFASVIHEIGSYTTEVYRYGIHPVLSSVFNQAYELLSDGGHILIRDGITEDKETRMMPEYITITNEDAVDHFLRFTKDFHGYSVDDGLVEPHACIRYTRQNGLVRLVVGAPVWFLVEFMRTYTWGDGSWKREVQERVGYASMEEYEDELRKAGFSVMLKKSSNEEYKAYFERFAKNVKPYNLMGVIVAGKGRG